jgi:hypothetical protein
VRPTVENVLFLHTVSIEAFGGSEGVRDLESLRAAVARPWGSSFGQDIEDFAVSIAVGGLETAEIALWFEGHSRRT